MGKTANTLPRFDTNLQKGDAISALQWNALASLLNGIKAFDGLWIKATPNGLHIGGGGGGGAGFPWNKLAFGYALSVDAGTHITTCTINPGAIRLHGITTLRLTVNTVNTVELTGDLEWVFLQYARPNNTLTLEHSSVEPESSSNYVKIPLYSFEAALVTPEGEDPYPSYSLKGIHHMGDVNLDAPIR